MIGLVLGACLVAVAAGCGGSERLSGPIVVRGSTTVLPIVSQVADGFARRHPYVDFDVDMVGSEDGIADLCSGLVPLAGSSRPLTEDERQSCRASGVDVATFEIAHDAVVLLSRTDPAVRCLTLAQIEAAAGSEARGRDSWEEVARASGTPVADLPSGPFTLVGPGPGSGTLAVFEAEALGPPAAARGVDARIRDDYTAVEAEQAIRNALATRPGSLGVVGYTTAVHWLGQLRPVAVDAGKGCVSPTPAAIRSGRYPLSRDLYLLVDVGAVRERPQVAAFVGDFLGPTGRDAPAQVGSVALSGSQADRVARKWRTRLSGGGS